MLSGCDLSEAPTGQFPFQGDQRAQIGGRATGPLSARYRLQQLSNTLLVSSELIFLVAFLLPLSIFGARSDLSVS